MPDVVKFTRICSAAMAGNTTLVVVWETGVSGAIRTFGIAVQVPESRYSTFMEVGARRKLSTMLLNVFSSPKSTRRNSLVPLRDFWVFQYVDRFPSWAMKAE